MRHSTSSPSPVSFPPSLPPPPPPPPPPSARHDISHFTRLFPCCRRSSPTDLSPPKCFHYHFLSIREWWKPSLSLSLSLTDSNMDPCLWTHTFTNLFSWVENFLSLLWMKLTWNFKVFICLFPVLFVSLCVYWVKVNIFKDFFPAAFEPETWHPSKCPQLAFLKPWSWLFSFCLILFPRLFLLVSLSDYHTLSLCITCSFHPSLRQPCHLSALLCFLLSYSPFPMAARPEIKSPRTPLTWTFRHVQAK